MNGQEQPRWVLFCKVHGMSSEDAWAKIRWDYIPWILGKWTEWENAGGSRFDSEGFDRWLKESIDGD